MRSWSDCLMLTCLNAREDITWSLSTGAILFQCNHGTTASAAAVPSSRDNTVVWFQHLLYGHIITSITFCVGFCQGQYIKFVTYYSRCSPIYGWKPQSLIQELGAGMNTCKGKYMKFVFLNPNTSQSYGGLLDENPIGMLHVHTTLPVGQL